MHCFSIHFNSNMLTHSARACRDLELKLAVEAQRIWDHMQVRESKLAANTPHLHVKRVGARSRSGSKIAMGAVGAVVAAVAVTSAAVAAAAAAAAKSMEAGARRWRRWRQQRRNSGSGSTAEAAAAAAAAAWKLLDTNSRPYMSRALYGFNVARAGPVCEYQFAAPSLRRVLAPRFVY